MPQRDREAYLAYQREYRRRHPRPKKGRPARYKTKSPSGSEKRHRQAICDAHTEALQEYTARLMCGWK